MKHNHSLLRKVYTIPVISLVLASCYTGSYIPDPYIVDIERQKQNIYYVPSSPNTPLLTEKNDFSFSVMRASGSKFTGAEIQAACLPWKHAGFIASYSGAGNRNGNPDYMTYHRFEIGAGYVSKFSKEGHFEIYGGLGNGKMMNSHYSGSSRINLNHFFLQPAIAISDKHQIIQFAVSSKFAGVNFKVRDTLFTTAREPFSSSQINSLYEQPFHVMWEPALSFRVGWKNFLFNAQYTLSSDLTNPDLHRSKNNFSIGVTLRCNTKTN
jgi:hypothetical protein